MFKAIHCSSVGISYRDANSFLDKLEALGTEIHALMIQRHGKTAIEGYWAPYAPGVIHGCQSLSKTVTGIALGAALHEGILGLDELLVDIFPEYRHLTQGRPYWDELKVKHIATMSAGMDTQPSVVSPDWVEDFFKTDIHHKPGTAYMYHSIGCSMVGMCIRKRSGKGMMDYLGEKVLRKMGVDPDSLMWHKHANGLENGSGGFVSTVRVNALLMELYRQGGVWQGERLLDENWVKFALQVQNPHVGGEALYGGMIWVRERCFVADGAMGQWGMLFPKEDVVIAINQTISAPDVDNLVRNAVYDFVSSIRDEEVPWTPEEERSFANRLSRLSIPQPVCQENPAALKALCGRTLTVKDGNAHFFADDLNIFDLAYVNLVRSFRFEAAGGDMKVHLESEQGSACCTVALRGYRPVCDVPPLGPNPVRTASVTGYFPDDHTLVMEVRWLESCRIHIVTIRWDEEGADMTTSRIPVGGFDVPDETTRAIWT